MIGPGPAPKVSVIVPVYNPGRHIDECIASILGQSVAADEYEAIFVDDGSTDGTGARLDALAAEHPNVTTIHIENSGWPGRPRNVGIDAARGEFLLFVDNDDWLGEEALERLYAAALRTGADIVVGKVVGHRRGPPLELFRRTIDHAVLGKDPLLQLLTPHKLFRADFVERHGLRFPEGRVRLEDHAFVVPALFAGATVTVQADYAFYHWVRRDDEGNASEAGLEPAYWSDLARVLDIVEAHTEPGDARDRLLSHWYGSKILVRLGGRSFARREPADRRDLFERVRPLALERFGPAVAAHLPAALRARAGLLEAGRLDELTALAEAEAGILGEATLESAAWEDGVLLLRVRGALVHEDGSPAVLPWAGVANDDVSLRAFVRSQADWDAALVPADVEVERHERAGGVHLVWRATITVDPRTAAAGAPLAPGVWNVATVVDAAGLPVQARPAEGGAALPPPAVLAEGGVAAVPFATRDGRLAIDLGQRREHVLEVATPSRAHVRATGRRGRLRVGVALPGVHAPAALADAGTLLLTAVGGGSVHIEAPAALATGTGDPVLEGHFDHVPPGRWRLWAQVGPRRRALPASLDVTRGGVTVVAPRSPLPAERGSAVKRMLRRLALR